MIEIFASFLVFFGSFFVFSAALGLLRMPDPISRIQTGTKATTLGALLILCGLAFLNPARAPQYILLVIFIFVSNPISSHALARASHSLEAHTKNSNGPPNSEGATK